MIVELKTQEEIRNYIEELKNRPSKRDYKLNHWDKENDIYEGSIVLNTSKSIEEIREMDVYKNADKYLVIHEVNLVGAEEQYFLDYCGQLAAEEGCSLRRVKKVIPKQTLFDKIFKKRKHQFDLQLVIGNDLDGIYKTISMRIPYSYFRELQPYREYTMEDLYISIM